MHIKTVLYNMLCALYYLQSAQVLHRDLKPANVLVNDCWAIKLWDFNLSRSIAPKKTNEEIDKEIPQASKKDLDEVVVLIDTETSTPKDGDKNGKFLIQNLYYNSRK
jgi:serine/threonine protein kinase